jgi:NitT/TauT family transport system ATP-binding protein
MPSAADVQGRIAVDSVEKTYGKGDEAVRALAPISFTVDSGEFVSILGPSGCGKTTLLKIVGDIVPPSAGVVTIDDRPAAELRRRRRIGYVFQTPVLLPWRSVRDNVHLPFEMSRRVDSGSGKAEVARNIDEMLSTVGLGGFEDRLPRELSGGMQARVSLARAFVVDASVLLMDEPFSALDELTRTEMAAELLRLWERLRTSVVFVTHHIEEAVLLSNRILVMSERPGEIRRTIEVTLPRPRTLETRKNPKFRDLVEDLVSDFHAQGLARLDPTRRGNAGPKAGSQRDAGGPRGRRTV